MRPVRAAVAYNASPTIVRPDEVRPRAHDHGSLYAVPRARLRHDGIGTAPFRSRRSRRSRPASELRVLLPLERALHELLIRATVGLRPERMDGRPLAPVEHSRYWMHDKSAARAISPPSASSSRTRWPLPVPPMAGLHGMLPTASKIDGKADGLHSEACRGQRGLDPRVARADDGDIKLSGVKGHSAALP